MIALIIKCMTKPTTGFCEPTICASIGSIPPTAICTPNTEPPINAAVIP
ncbi:hypothetical protein [Candidatus Flexifilum breve]